MPTVNRYTVIVGNIGTVYDGNSFNDAKKTYGDYKRMSLTGLGRAGHEDVSLFDGEDPKWEHFGQRHFNET